MKKLILCGFILLITLKNVCPEIPSLEKLARNRVARQDFINHYVQEPLLARALLTEINTKLVDKLWLKYPYSKQFYMYQCNPSDQVIVQHNGEQQRTTQKSHIPQEIMQQNTEASEVITAQASKKDLVVHGYRSGKIKIINRNTSESYEDTFEHEEPTSVDISENIVAVGYANKLIKIISLNSNKVRTIRERGVPNALYIKGNCLIVVTSFGELVIRSIPYYKTSIYSELVADKIVGTRLHHGKLLVDSDNNKTSTIYIKKIAILNDLLNNLEFSDVLLLIYLHQRFSERLTSTKFDINSYQHQLFLSLPQYLQKKLNNGGIIEIQAKRLRANMSTNTTKRS